MKYALFEAHASLIEDFIHPSLKKVRFVLTDDQANANSQGIEYEDFPDVAKTAINMPIKMLFDGKKIGGHVNSITIGHITNVNEDLDQSDGVHRLIADGVLYAEEFPTEVQHLVDLFEAKKSPGFSWELGYENSIIKNGINWLKGLVTKAATLVGNPAYGSRTALLALASNSNLSEEEFSKELIALAGITPIETIEGGNNVTEEEKTKLAELESTAAILTARITELEGQLEAANAEKTAQADVIAGYKKNDLITARVQALTDAGIKVEVDDTKKEFFAALSEEVFTTYVADLADVQKKATKTGTATAERKGMPNIPKPNAQAETENDELPSFAELKTRMKTFSNPATAAVTE
jgi:hypothetical protein